jgi:sulfur carrier protein
VTLLVNGESIELPAGATVADLLSAMQLAVRHVAVEVNLEIVPRAKHAAHRLQEADRVEVVTLVGGG